jgi:hypothetical protein
MVLLVLGLAAGPVLGADYDVTITNLTKEQTFTPILVVSHMPSVDLFQPGQPASPELEAIAEAGNIMPMDALLGTLPQVRDTNTNGALLGPGESVTIAVEAGGPFDRISLAGMLLPTNDTFVAVRSLRIGPASLMAHALAYDAGTEFNDQNCAQIPGPLCMGEGLSAPAPDDEGFIHVSNGFHDLGTADETGNAILLPFDYDWRNPVASVSVVRHDDDDEGSDDAAAPDSSTTESLGREGHSFNLDAR